MSSHAFDTRNRRRIAVITGARSEFGLLAPVMTAIEQHEQLRLMPIVTGMHLDPRFGLTVREVEEKFEIAARVLMHVEDERDSAMARSVGKGINGLTKTFDRLEPEIVLVLGDRTEAFAAAVGACLSRRVVAHIHGGDASRGGYDEYMRHAITKLAHVHFAATEKSAERLRRLGERPEMIHVVGAPGLDTILHAPHAPAEEVAKHVRINLNEPYLLLIQHPVSTTPENAGHEMATTLEALRRIDIPVVAIYPNSDPGSESIIRALEREAHDTRGFYLVKSLPRSVFLTVFAHARALVGNSSCGAIESTSFHVPTVNIGPRQQGRECGANVIDVPHEEEAIYKAVMRALTNEGFLRVTENAQSPYGDGRASEKIADHLAQLKITPELFVKQIAYEDV